jgi:hypothetical protein
VRPGKVLVFSGCNSHPATGSLQPVAIGATVEVTKPSEPTRQTGRSGDSASRQAVIRVNVEQASKRPMWSPTLLGIGEGRRRWGGMGTVGIDRPTSDQNSAGHRGNDDGMSVHGDPTQHGKPDRCRGAPPQPDAREGQAGPTRVAERFVVPLKPGNSGGGKGPQFKANARSNRQPGDWYEPNTSTQGWEIADGVAH